MRFLCIVKMITTDDRLLLTAFRWTSFVAFLHVFRAETAFRARARRATFSTTTIDTFHDIVMAIGIVFFGQMAVHWTCPPYHIRLPCLLLLLLPLAVPAIIAPRRFFYIVQLVPASWFQDDNNDVRLGIAITEIEKPRQFSQLQGPIRSTESRDNGERIERVESLNTSRIFSSPSHHRRRPRGMA